MTSPVIAAAAYVLLTAHAPAHGLTGDSTPIRLQPPLCQLTMDMSPRHPQPVQHDRGNHNHISLRWIGDRQYYDRHHHRRRHHDHFEDQR